jgi:Zn-dependent protease with chaperone function
MNLLTPDELFGISLHEIAHHIYKRKMIISTLSTFLAGPLFVFPMFRSRVMSSFGVGFLPGIILVCLAAFLVASLHRHLEYSCDSLPARMGYGEATMNGLMKIIEKQTDFNKEKFEKLHPILKIISTILKPITTIAHLLFSTHPEPHIRKMIMRIMSDDIRVLNPTGKPANILTDFGITMTEEFQKMVQATIEASAKSFISLDSIISNGLF